MVLIMNFFFAFQSIFQCDVPNRRLLNFTGNLLIAIPCF